MKSGVGPSWLAVCSVLALLQVSPSAHAMTKNDLQEQSKEARKRCLTGRYDQGMNILADLFSETRDPTYVYNQGRCSEQNQRLDDAIAHFKEYLRSDGLTPEDRAAGEKHLADCQSEKQKEAGGPALPAPVPTAVPVANLAAVEARPPSGPSSTPARLDLSANAESASGEREGSRRPLLKTWWFWTGAAAVVVAGTITAVVLAGRSNGRCDGASLTCQGVK
jgi:hypothetical protein